MSPETKPGDLVVVTGHHVGERERLGEILEVLGESDRPRYRVRWDDEHVSIFSPGNDAVIRHVARGRRPRR